MSKYDEERKSEELSELIHIETCGLHVVNGLLQNGAKATDWNLKNSCHHCLTYSMRARHGELITKV